MLKRRKEISRPAAVPAPLNGLIASKLARKRPNEYLFRQRARGEVKAREISRHGALRRMKKLFGPAISNHSFRHSNVAFLIHQGYSQNRIATTLSMSLENVENYSHTNSAEEMRELFKNIA